MRFFRILLTVTIVVISMTGCMKDPGFSRVSGVVTYEGKPLAGAIVSFVPTEPDGIAAGGFTDEKGAYALTAVTARGTRTGTMPGKYRVAIAKTVLIEDAVTMAYHQGESTYDEYQSRIAKTGSESQAINMIPERYFSAKTSGLEAHIESRRPSVFNFDLHEK